MNKYLLYTFEGYCEDPNGDAIENCQYLGKIEASDEDEAIKKFFKEQTWATLSGYTLDGVKVVRLHENERI